MSSHEQDLRCMSIGGSLGGWVGVVLVSVILNLLGLIYYRGWASKDVLIEFGLVRSLYMVIIIVLILGFGCSLGYSVNLIQFCRKIISQYGVISWEWGRGVLRILVLVCYTILGVTLGVYILRLGGFYLDVYVSLVWGKFVYLVVSLLVLISSIVWKREVFSRIIYLQDIYQVFIIQIGVFFKKIFCKVELVVDIIFEKGVELVWVVSGEIVDLIVAWDLIFSIVIILFVIILMLY